MTKILLLEPDGKLAKYIKDHLGDEGIDVNIVKSELDLEQRLEKTSPDLILLEHDLNNLDPHDLSKQLSKEFPDLPIITIVKEHDQNHLIRDFKLGVKDYVTKPISIEELLTRINLALRQEDNVKNVIKIDNLKIDLNKFSVSRGGKEIDLSPREFSLLKFLARNKGRVLSRDVILNRVWNYPVDIQSRAVDVYIGYLRNKIDQNFEKKLIHTVRGFGYMLKE
jgi:DNA-binding response OmpR family regulator